MNIELKRKPRVGDLFDGDNSNEVITEIVPNAGGDYFVTNGKTEMFLDDVQVGCVIMKQLVWTTKSSRKELQ